MIVPPVEVIPYATLAKVKEFFDSGGVVIGYVFLPSKSATIGKSMPQIACTVPWHLGRRRTAAELGMPSRISGGASRSVAAGEPTPE